jgi:hypothetical protein
MTDKKCESDISDHHSDDLVQVHEGRGEPRYVCGYHLMRESSSR